MKIEAASTVAILGSMPMPLIYCLRNKEPFFPVVLEERIEERGEKNTTCSQTEPSRESAEECITKEPLGVEGEAADEKGKSHDRIRESEKRLPAALARAKIAEEKGKRWLGKAG